MCIQQSYSSEVFFNGLSLVCLMAHKNALGVEPFVDLVTGPVFGVNELLAFSNVRES